MVQIFKIETKNLKYNLNFYTHILFVITVFVIFLVKAHSIGMFKSIPHWVDAAIPAAISKIYYSNKEGYTSLIALEELYYKDQVFETNITLATVNERIQRIKNLNHDSIAHTGIKILGNDDKGILAFNIIAFSIFGAKANSLYILYFSLLALSIVCYLITFYRHKEALLALSLLILAYTSYVPILCFEQQTTSVLALRAFPALSLCATLYLTMIYYSVVFKKNINIQKNFFKSFVILQFFLVFLVIHIRTTALWQLIAINAPAAIAIIAILIRSINTSDSKRAFNTIRSQKTIIVVCVLGAFLFPIHNIFYNIYQRYAFSEKYNNEQDSAIKTRLFFHNIFSGLAFEPNLAEKFQIRIDDWSVYDAAGRYMQNTQQLDKWQNIIAASTADPVHIHGRIANWVGYDQVVKQMFIATCSKHLGYCINSIFYKLDWFMNYLLWSCNLNAKFPDYSMFYPLEWENPMPKMIDSFIAGLKSNNLFVPILNIKMIFMLGVIAIFYSIENLIICFISLGTLGIFSFASVIIGYPAPWANTDTAILSFAVFYLSILGTMYAIIKFFSKKILYSQLATNAG